MANKAGSGFGTTFGIGVVPTLVLGVKTVQWSGIKVTTEEISDFASASGGREFLATLIDLGEFAISGNRIPLDAGQVLMWTTLNARLPATFTAQNPPIGTQVTTGDKWVFSGILTEITQDNQFDKAVTFSAKIKVSGLVTLTAGS
jgi:hypothetical protein